MARPIRATPRVHGDDAKRILERLQPNAPVDKAAMERQMERVRTSLAKFRVVSIRKAY
jgi:hypothetical protein